LANKWKQPGSGGGGSALVRSRLEPGISLGYASEEFVKE